MNLDTQAAKIRTITLLPDGQSYRHSIDRWADEYPISRLDNQIALYRKLAVKRPRPYQPDFDALVAFRAVMRRKLAA